MAGIGFELRKILAGNSWASLAHAYGYAGMLGSGAWLLSVLGIVLMGSWELPGGAGQGAGQGHFQVAVAWLTSASLVVSGLFQLVFTRYVSDQVYQQKFENIVPNLLGALGVMTLLASLLAVLFALLVFDWQRLSMAYGFWLLVNFLMLCNVWLLVIFVAGLRQYRRILLGFLLAYSLIVLLAWCWRDFGIVGQLLAFYTGHALLLLYLFRLVLLEYGGRPDVSRQFLQSPHAHHSLMLTGFCLSLGIWIDKWLLWLNPETSIAVGALLRAAPNYDQATFLAYLAMIPGMASFLLRVETDFVEQHRAYYQRLESGNWQQIQESRQRMDVVLHDALREVAMVQGLVVLVLVLLAEPLLSWLEIPLIQVAYFRIAVGATSVLVVFMAILNVIFYFNFLGLALVLAAGLLTLNTLLTTLTLYLEPGWYGSGFLLSLLLVTGTGYLFLRRCLKNLEYRTFMMQ